MHSQPRRRAGKCFVIKPGANSTIKSKGVVMDKRKRVIVAGGGAAGMMAAVSAVRVGAQVTILEKNPRIGKKILATGNGRCNYTNVNTDLRYYYGKNPQFIQGALTGLTVEDTIEFFKKLGIE